MIRSNDLTELGLPVHTIDPSSVLSIRMPGVQRPSVVKKKKKKRKEKKKAIAVMTSPGEFRDRME